MNQMKIQLISITALMIFTGICCAKTGDVRLSDFDIYQDGRSSLSFNINGTCDIYDHGKIFMHQEKSKCSGLTTGQWSVTFGYGTLVGETSCNEISGIVPEVVNRDDILTYVSSAMNNTDTGHNCWCRITQYISPDGIAKTMTDSVWAFLYTDGTNCANNCVYSCSDSVRNEPVFRTAIFGKKDM